MQRPTPRFALALLSGAVLHLACAGAQATGGQASAAQASRGGPRSSNPADVPTLFAEWRQFQKPKLVGGVPDYSAAAMAAQHRELPAWIARAASIDVTGWTVAQQVDLHIIRAEMNGLDFDHRVLKPWSQNPAFYVTVFDEKSDQPAREGPFALGALELWTYAQPMAADKAAEVAALLKPIPALLAQARTNLTGNARDLWVFGIESVKQQKAILATLNDKVSAASELAAALKAAQEATDSYIGWLEQQAPSKTGPSGVGIANYDWYLKHVQLLPYSWADEVALMERELARATASLALEEQKNRALSRQEPVASAEEHDKKFNAAIGEYVKFFKEHDIVTVRDFMEPALRAEIGKYHPGPLEFFTEVDYREPIMMRTHGYHWIDLAWMKQDPHPSPVRRGGLLYNIFDSRTEGFATAIEELMMHEGLFEAHPRSRELVYILVAQRAARALGDLRMHANQLPLEGAAKFASENTPRGWLRLTGNTVRWEQHLYLQQPAYGTSYLIGKLEVDKLIAARARQLGERFSLRTVLDELNTTGLIPITLVRWQLTGEDAMGFAAKP